jgi:alpha-glucosidase
MATKTPPNPTAVDVWERQNAALCAHHENGALTRVEAVAADILRVRSSATGALAARRAWDPMMLNLPPAGLAVRNIGGMLELAANALTAHLDLSNGTLSFVAASGGRFAEDLAPPQWREVSLQETALEHMPERELPPGEACTGVFLEKRMAPSNSQCHR